MSRKGNDFDPTWDTDRGSDREVLSEADLIWGNDTHSVGIFVSHNQVISGLVEPLAKRGFRKLTAGPSTALFANCANNSAQDDKFVELGRRWLRGVALSSSSVWLV